MHILNRVLVRIYNGCNCLCDEICSRDEAIRAARSWAETETEDYYPRVFDWRETDTAGGWKDQYPENVLLSKENINVFVEELEAALEDQLNEVNYHLDEVCKVSSDIKELVDLEYNNHSVPVWHLLQLSELMNGTYTCDSGFYDTDSYTARITRETINSVKESPDDWALVMFDYHY